jgi:hypothetical protein
MSQQRVFRQQFGSASGQISKRSEHKGGRQWFDPMPNTFWERVQVKTEENTHSTMGPLLCEIWRMVRAYAQNGPRWLYAYLTYFRKKACSILYNRPDFLNGCRK